MNATNIAKLRLSSQHIAQADFARAEDVVAHMGAMQAQDYPGALWSIGLRTHDLTQSDVERAITERKIIRTWPMRGTLHFVAAEDARWMIKLLATRATAAAATRRKQLEIDDTVIAKSRTVIENALSGGKCLTRARLCEQLDKNGIATAGQRGIHLLRHFSELGVLCFGPHEGKQPTFVLMEEWLPPTRELSYEESLAELTERYFTSHGPATLQDFAGWTKLTLTDARLGLSAAASALTKETVGETDYWFGPHMQPDTTFSAYLLPGFDEYMLGYKNRSAALPLVHAEKIVPGGNGMFRPTVVLNGQVAGTWKKIVRKSGIRLQLEPFRPFAAEELKHIETAAKRYSAFTNTAVVFDET